jgi:hypothetical protein
LGSFFPEKRVQTPSDFNGYATWATFPATDGDGVDKVVQGCQRVTITGAKPARQRPLKILEPPFVSGQYLWMESYNVNLWLSGGKFRTQLALLGCQFLRSSIKPFNVAESSSP